MTTEEQLEFETATTATSGSVGIPAYQRLVNMIADRVHRECGGNGEHDFETAESALIEADTGDEDLGRFIDRYEALLRKKYARGLAAPHRN